jgi:ParB family chromosome partitioning protein
VQRVALALIDDNPYQARSEYGSLDDLTDSLLAQRENRPETSGLLQLPLARQVNGRIELALGHRRRRAFITLLQSGAAEYATLPVEIADLSDEAMADIAWDENQKRLDLSDIERALAIERALRAFDWTQAGIGARWGLSQGAVSNLLRLLRLPDKIKALIRDRAITGRHGRALLPLLPLEGRVEVYLDMLQEAPGVYRPVEALEVLVENWIERNTYNLADVAWDESWDPQTPETRACADCQFRIKTSGQWRCSSPGECILEKERIYNWTVGGPRRAAAVYAQYQRWDAVRVDQDNAWIVCSGCRRGVREVQTREPWLAARQMYNVRICPVCAGIANLHPRAQEVNDPATPAPAAPGLHSAPTTYTVPPFQPAREPGRADRWTEYTPEPEPPAPAVAVSPIERAAIIRLRLAPGDALDREARLAVQFEGEWSAAQRHEETGTAGDVFALLGRALVYIEGQRQGTPVAVFAAQEVE